MHMYLGQYVGGRPLEETARRAGRAYAHAYMYMRTRVYIHSVYVCKRMYIRRPAAPGAPMHMYIRTRVHTGVCMHAHVHEAARRPGRSGRNA